MTVRAPIRRNVSARSPEAIPTNGSRRAMAARRSHGASPMLTTRSNLQPCVLSALARASRCLCASVFLAEPLEDAGVGHVSGTGPVDSRRLESERFRDRDTEVLIVDGVGVGQRAVDVEDRELLHCVSASGRARFRYLLLSPGEYVRCV